MKILKEYGAYWIIGLLFVVRLYGILDPPLEVNHHWRQVTGLMVARNYHEGNSDFFHPMIDDIGVGESRSSGVIGMEFPLINYTHALVSDIFGYEHWYGRLIVLIASSLGLIYFFLLVKKITQDQRTATVAVALLGVSVWFAFSRKMMPDTVAISFGLAALFYALKCAEQFVWSSFLAFVAWSSLAVLIKISAVVILSPTLLVLFVLFHNKPRNAFIFLIGSALPLIALIYWYFIHNAQLSQESGIWYNTGESLSDAWSSITTNGKEVAAHFYFRTMMAYTVLPFIVLGLIRMLMERRRVWLAAAGIILLVFSLYALRSGRHFALQHYYMIPLAPLFAFIAALGLTYIKKNTLLISATMVLCIEGVANQQHDFRIHDRNQYKMTLEDLMNAHVPSDALIVITGDGNPQGLYLSHRKGWVCSSEQVCDFNYLSKVNAAGAKFLVVDKHKVNLSCSHTVVFENADFVIARLEFN